MYEVKRSNRSIVINHTREEYMKWLTSTRGGNVICLGVKLQKYLPNTTSNERSFIMTGRFINE